MINRNRLTPVHRNVLNLNDVIRKPKLANRHAPDIQVKIPRNEFFTINADINLPTVVAYYENCWYLFSQDVIEAYDERLKYISDATLYSGVTESGEYFILPVTETWKGYPRSWNETLVESIAIAEHQWVKIRPNNTSNCYEIIDQQRLNQAIDWPEEELDNLLVKAFSNDAYVNRENHPLLLEIAY